MRIAKLFFVAIALIALTGCACRTKSVGAGNVPLAEEGNVLSDINFDFDSFEIRSDAKAILANHAEWLGGNSSSSVEIEGHTDERGTNEYNMVLGAKRAQATMDYLRSLGVSESRMSTVSYGEELPLDPRHNEAAWARNRRAHFNVK